MPVGTSELKQGLTQEQIVANNKQATKILRPGEGVTAEKPLLTQEKIAANNQRATDVLRSGNGTD